MIKHAASAVFFVSLTCGAVAVSAESPTNKGPEIIKFKMGDLLLPFTHWKHQKIVKDECLRCHTTNTGKIVNWNKETAHTLCITCHEKEDKGPVRCEQCHKDFYSNRLNRAEP
jgi:predicted CXXCH cytochrome family protein